MRSTAHHTVVSFRDFVVELGALRASVDAGSGRPSPSAEDLRLRAIALIEAQSAVGAVRGGRLDAEQEAEFRYALASLADEYFLEIDWCGRESWRNRLVETHFFGSRAAGQRIFDRMDSLLDSDAAVRAPLAAVYLMMLGLGFRGRFRGQEADAEIERRRSLLRAWIERKSPMLLGDWKSAMRQAYEHTVEEGPAVSLPTPARWWGLAAAVVIVWIGGSGYVWSALADQISARIETVHGAVEAARPRVSASANGARP